MQQAYAMCWSTPGITVVRSHSLTQVDAHMLREAIQVRDEADIEAKRRGMQNA